MPSIKNKICNKCKKIVPYNHDCRDKTQDKVYNKTKRTNHAFYNSNEWRKKRAYIMKRDCGLCQECLEIGITEQADVVDHIIDLNKRWDLRLDDTNLRSLCHQCHNSKTFSKG